MTPPRSLRFGLIADGVDAAGLPDPARRAEAAGYATLLFPDHLGMAAPLTSLAAAAAVTQRVRVGTLVLNNDFRHPAVLAQDVATADLLSGGRVELGLGAGHMRAEYDAIGLPFDKPVRRIERLGEAASLLRRLFAGETVTHHGHYRLDGHRLEPLPAQGAGLPILIGGNGTRLLTAAAGHADIVQFTGFLPLEGGKRSTPTHFSASGLADRLAVARRAAGERFDRLELSVLVQRVVLTSDRVGAVRRLVAERGWGMGVDELLDSPFLLAGTTEQIAAQVRAYRDRFGISYFAVFNGRSDGFDDVVALAAGT